MRCILKKNGIVLAQEVEQASTLTARLKGLMFDRQLPVGKALLLEPCPQIHTCFMRFSLDIVFLDRNNCVVAVLEKLKPWRMSKFYPRARRTLELPANVLQGRVQVGDELIFI